MDDDVIFLGFKDGVTHTAHSAAGPAARAPPPRQLPLVVLDDSDSDSGPVELRPVTQPPPAKRRRRAARAAQESEDAALAAAIAAADAADSGPSPSLASPDCAVCRRGGDGASCFLGHVCCRRCLDAQSQDVAARSGRWFGLGCSLCLGSPHAEIRESAFYAPATLACLLTQPGPVPVSLSAPAPAFDSPHLVPVPPANLESAFCESVFFGPRPPYGVEPPDASGRGRMAAFAAAARVVRVERVVNPRLWRSYCILRASIGGECPGGDPGERWLMHGSKSVGLESIWRSAAGAEGVDERYGGGGMLGRGAYFAEAAAYSHGYAASRPLAPSPALPLAQLSPAQAGSGAVTAPAMPPWPGLTLPPPPPPPRRQSGRAKGRAAAKIAAAVAAAHAAGGAGPTLPPAPVLPVLPGNGKPNYQMLVARVATGVPYLPGVSPLPPGTAAPNLAGLLHPPEGYHSVCADVGGPLKAVATYKANQSYPAYLVTYSYG